MSFSSSSGSGNVTASDTRALIRNLASGSFIQASATYFVTGLSAGSHTFTLEYRSSIGTATFLNRSITVIPMP
jgi:hypothetical protein